MSAAETRPILVVGAGVIGLTTAIRLREHGHSVVVIAQETPSTILNRDTAKLKSTPPGTYTSSGSGGFWMQFLLDGEEIEGMCAVTYKEFAQQLDDGIGVDMLPAFLLKATSMPTELPWFADLTKMTVETPKTDARIPQEYESALRFTTPVVQMGPYLTFLEKRAQSLGVVVELTSDHTPDGCTTAWTAEEVATFAEKQIGGERPIVVNCCGVGAGSLADEEMIPGRGVTVRVARPSDKRYVISEDRADGFLSRDGLLAYAIPRGEEYTLGGTIFEGDWRETVTEEEVRALKERVDKLIPGIADQLQTGVWSGLRPIRKDGKARIEVQKEGLGGRVDFDVIANYGHSGCGVTMCWGCADEVVKIVERLGSA